MAFECKLLLATWSWTSQAKDDLKFPLTTHVGKQRGRDTVPTMYTLRPHGLKFSFLDIIMAKMTLCTTRNPENIAYQVHAGQKNYWFLSKPFKYSHEFKWIKFINGLKFLCQISHWINFFPNSSYVFVGVAWQNQTLGSACWVLSVKLQGTKGGSLLLSFTTLCHQYVFYINLQVYACGMEPWLNSQYAQ